MFIVTYFLTKNLQVDDQQDLSDPMLLKNLDPKCVRSLNGCRVTVDTQHTKLNINIFDV